MADVTGSKAPIRSATYDGKEYEAVREGLAEILNPRTAAQEDGGGSKSQKVFYNPIQQFNRDLSVLAIRAFAENLATIRRLRKESEPHKAKHAGHKGLKRKRGLEEEGQRYKNAKSPPEGQLTKAVEPEAKSHGAEDQAVSNGTSSAEVHGADLEAEAGGSSLEAVVNGTEGIPTEPRADRNTTNGYNGPPRIPAKSPFRILDALSATGLRALRYAKEIPTATFITANDLSLSATSSIKLNIQHNDVAEVVHPTTGDARAHMYESASSTKHADQRLYQVIDLDPYGTAAPFFDAAVQALADGGLLCVTCTDGGVFASVGYLEKTFSQYGGLPFKGPQSHEGGLRLILHAIATSAARYGIAIEPLLSLSIDFYARFFVRIRKSPAEVKFLAGKTMLVYNCDSGCGAWSTQFLAQTKEKKAKNGDTCFAYSLAQAPSTSQYCEHCGFKTHLSGPMWGGPLHNPYFIQKILDILPTLNKEVYGTLPRLEGMLTLAMNETIFNESPALPSSPDALPQEKPPADIPFPSLPPQTPIHHPFFFLPSHLSKTLHCVAPSDAAFRGALLHLGYRTTRSHTKPGSIVTDAPWSVVWEIMREWVRQKANVKDGSLREGMAGWGIMRRARVRESGEVERAKKELQEVIKENCEDVRELRTKVEAVLYRLGIVHGSGDRGVKTEDGEGTLFMPEDISTNASKDEVATASPPPGKGRPVPIDTNTLTINFDEALGKEPMGKRMVRYQMNPRPDWGPMNKATG